MHYTRQYILEDVYSHHLIYICVNCKRLLHDQYQPRCHTAYTHHTTVYYIHTQTLQPNQSATMLRMFITRILPYYAQLFAVVGPVAAAALYFKVSIKSTSCAFTNVKDATAASLLQIVLNLQANVYSRHG
jgi:hypothetical protein